MHTRTTCEGATQKTAYNKYFSVTVHPRNARFYLTEYNKKGCK